MPTYERSTTVDAPLDAVWAFHAGVDGLRALTPRWLHLRIESVTGPDGGRPTTLGPGTEIRATVRPFGLGPRQAWTARIEARERRDGAAFFRDAMVDGPFEEWRHTHCFYADGDATRLRDLVEYEAPGGAVGDRVAPAGLAPFFRYRHRRTRALLERP